MKLSQLIMSSCGRFSSLNDIQRTHVDVGRLGVGHIAALIIPAGVVANLLC